MHARGSGFRQHTIRFAAVLTLLLVAVPPPAIGGEDRVGDSLVQVLRVVDGDTIVVQDGQSLRRVRLKCVDTPETVDPRKPIQFYGPEASAFTKQKLSQKRVRLEFDSRDRVDRYHRALAYVFLEDGTLLNRELVGAGYARTTRYPCRYRAEFRRLEQEACESRRGLWSDAQQWAVGCGKRSGTVVGNSRSKIYHSAERAGRISAANRVYFETEANAIKAGYQPARR